MENGQKLGGERVLELARTIVGASPGGREAAPELFAARSGGGPAFAEAASSILSMPTWAGSGGAILFPEPGSNDGIPALLVVWLEPRPSAAPGFPSQLALDLPAGRYAVVTYDSEKRLAVGAETASGPPVVCGPPFDRGALAVLVRPVGKPLGRSRERFSTR